ncbi:MAG: hypothetical protein ACOCQO_00575 [Halanaerobiaceae bacterium]
MKKTAILLISIILISLISLSAFAQENRIKVNVNIASRQELTVEEPLAISFQYPWEGMAEGEALIFENVGKVNIRSNVDWSLNINSSELYRDLEIYIRKSNDRYANWQRLDNSSALVTGENGNNNISWDLKIVQSRSDYSINSRNNSERRVTNKQDTRKLDLMYTLTEI